MICLALSAGLKIYPMLFGLVLLLEMRWREALRCVFYGLLAFLLPALIFGGVNPLDLIRNLTDMSSDTMGEGFGYKVNFANTLSFLFSALLIPASRTVLNILSYLLGALLLGSAFLQKTAWKRVCILTVLIVALPGFSYIYTLIFMLIPAVLFLNESETTARTPLQYTYAFLLAACFMPLPFTGMIYANYYPNYPMTVSTFAEGVALIFISVLLITEAGIILFRKMRTHGTERRSSIEASAE